MTTHERGLRLRPLRPGDEAAFREAHRVMAASDGFTFGLGLGPGMSWRAYLKALDDERAGIALSVDRVPAKSTEEATALSATWRRPDGTRARGVFATARPASALSGDLGVVDENSG